MDAAGAEGHETEPTGVVLWRRVDRRRAVLAELLRAGRPLRAGDIAERLERRGYRMPRHGPKVVADILTAQWRIGRVERVSRGWYRIVETAIPPSTLRRIARWETTPIQYEELNRRWKELTGAA